MANPWAISLQTTSLMAVIEKQAKETLKDSKKFLFTRAPWAHWLRDQPAFQVDTAGTIVNACGGNDIRVDLWVTTRLRVPSRNTVRLNVSLSYRKDAWDVFKCPVLATLFWPIVGLVTVIDNKVPWWGFVGYFAVFSVQSLITYFYAPRSRS
jgi:hypothetical protein